MPEFSVIIPSYNHASFISEAVQSVLDQSFSDLELIIVDDGSSDNTLEVLARFSDPRLRVFAQQNQGAHAAINQGLGLSTGAYLAILNSDDKFHPHRLAKALAEFCTDPQVGLVGSYIEIMDQDSRTIGTKHGYADCSPWLLDVPERSFRSGSDLHNALLTENYWSTTSNFIFPRKWFETIGDFRPLRFAHDWDFALRMAKNARMVMLPEPLMSYRVHASNTIRKDKTEMIFEICWVLAVHIPQHLASLEMIEPLGKPTIDGLLHSIYTFDFERVLSVMLMQRLAENPRQALAILNPSNPIRESYLAYIQRELEKTPNNSSSSHSEPTLKHIARELYHHFRKRST